MDAQGEFAARVLESGLRSLAADVAAQVEGDAAEAVDAANGPRFKQLADDTEVRLRYLGAALAAGAPELFAAHVAWTAQSWRAREVPLSLLERSLEALRDVLTAELPDASAALAVSCVQGGLAALGEGASPPVSLLESAGPEFDRARRFLLALLEKRRDDACAVVLDGLDAGMSLAEVQTEIVARAQGEIGRMWQVGEVHVGEEHLASRIVEHVLAMARERLRRAEASGRSALFCSTAGDTHDIGARMVADCLEVAGWDVYFLGGNVPAADMVRSLRDFDADLLAISVGLALHLRTCADSIRAVREELGEGAPPILVGGPPFALVPRLWRAVEADACADTSVEALAAAELLVPPRRS